MIGSVPRVPSVPTIREIEVFMEIMDNMVKDSDNTTEDIIRSIELYQPWARDAVRLNHTLHGMGIAEDEIVMILRGNTRYLFEGMMNPLTGAWMNVGVLRIQIGSARDDDWYDVLVNGQVSDDFFRNGQQLHEVTDSPERLREENSQLYVNLRDAQRRYDDLWLYCQELERRSREVEKQLRTALMK